MLRKSDSRSKSRPLADWFQGKSVETRAIFDHIVRQYKRIGKIIIRPTMNMIVVSTPRKGIAYIVLRKSYVDVVFPFKQAYRDNLCFHKITPAPGGSREFNHYLRIMAVEDVNEEVIRFMKLAYELGL